MPPSDRPKELDPIERRLRGIEARLLTTEDARINMQRYFEARVNALEVILRGLLKEKDGK